MGKTVRWLVILFLLLGGIGLLVAQELRYDALVSIADARADTLALTRARVDSLMEIALERSAQVAALEIRVREDSVRYARERLALRAQLTVAREEGERIAGDLRSRLDETGRYLLDSLQTSHREEVEILNHDIAILEARNADLELLRDATAKALAENRTALEACQCALDEADVVIRSYQEATGSRSVLGKAWDAISSRYGLAIIGAAGAYFLIRELTDDGGGTVVVRDNHHDY